MLIVTAIVANGRRSGSIVPNQRQCVTARLAQARLGILSKSVNPSEQFANAVPTEES